jgi:hypothetical protein
MTRNVQTGNGQMKCRFWVTIAFSAVVSSVGPKTRQILGSDESSSREVFGRFMQFALPPFEKLCLIVLMHGAADP